MMMHDSEHVIIVRDRRKPRQFVVDNVVIDEYWPIIGDNGFAFYCLLARMASKGDEKAWPGYRMIQGHSGWSASTVAALRQLLEWCELIEVVQGGGHRPNYYYLLEPKHVTPEFLEVLLGRVESWPEKHKYKKSVLRRIERWRPLSAHFNGKPSVRVVHVSQQRLRLALESTSDTEAPTALSEAPTALSEVPTALSEVATALPEVPTSEREAEQQQVNNNKTTTRKKQRKQQQLPNPPAAPDVVDALEEMGVLSPMLEILPEEFSLRTGRQLRSDDVRAWRAWMDENNAGKPRDRQVGVGLIISYLRRGLTADQRFYDAVRFSESLNIVR